MRCVMYNSRRKGTQKTHMIGRGSHNWKKDDLQKKGQKIAISESAGNSYIVNF